MNKEADASRCFRISTLLKAILSLTVLVSLAVWVFPSSAALTMRNAVLARSASAEDLDWHPDRPPREFLVARRPAPPEFVEAAERALEGADRNSLDAAIRLALHLHQADNAGGAIQSTAREAYRRIGAGEGDCSDFAQVYNGLAIAAAIPVRRWALSFESFGRGHAFSEVFVRSLDRWVLIDTYNAFYAVDPVTRRPLSALEYRDRLSADGEPLVEVVSLIPGTSYFRNDADLFAYYRRGLDQYYVWWGNNVFDYDEHPLVHALRSAPRAIQQLAALTVGVLPGFRFVANPLGAHHLRVARLTLGLTMLEGLAFLVTSVWILKRTVWPAARERWKSCIS